MRLRNVRGADAQIAASEYVIAQEASYKGRWSALFAERRKEADAPPRPLHLEIGTGKGQFLTRMAELHKDIDFLGIEKFSSVLVRAVQKAEDAAFDNLLLVRAEAERIGEIFDKHELHRIYLNFSDPWPKERHAKRRLTSKTFLRRYSELLVPGGTVEFKTDNRALFDFSLEELSPAGFEALYVTYDLHADAEGSADNCMTEYETRFSAQGHPICKMIVRPVSKGG